jgi:hypothetical protein
MKMTKTRTRTRRRRRRRRKRTGNQKGWKWKLKIWSWGWTLNSSRHSWKEHESSSTFWQGCMVDWKDHQLPFPHIQVHGRVRRRKLQDDTLSRSTIVIPNTGGSNTTMITKHPPLASRESTITAADVRIWTASGSSGK